MDLFSIFTVSGSGMKVQRSRMNVASGNLANSETTRTPEGGPYRRRDVVLRTVPVRKPFSSLLAANLSTEFDTSTPDHSKGALMVEVEKIIESSREPKKVYDPQHPDTDAEGFVSYPDINTMEEVMDLLSAVRSYEANLTVFNATKTLIRRILELSRTS